MKVIRANVLGFCMGVRRAVRLARAEAESSAGRVFALGPLIHSPQALAELESLGVKTIAEDALESPPPAEASTTALPAEALPAKANPAAAPPHAEARPAKVPPTAPPPAATPPAKAPPTAPPHAKAPPAEALPAKAPPTAPSPAKANPTEAPPAEALPAKAPPDEAPLPDALRGASVIIRAHGASPRVEEALRLRGAAIVDATCPRVKASQLKALELAEAGCLLFLAGEKSHAEIAGILGYAELGALRRGQRCCGGAVGLGGRGRGGGGAVGLGGGGRGGDGAVGLGGGGRGEDGAVGLGGGGRGGDGAAELGGGSAAGEAPASPGLAAACAVVGSAEEARAAAAAASAEAGRLAAGPGRDGAEQQAMRAALIGQTTISPEEYGAIAEEIARFFPALEVADTICAATRERQDSLRELLGQADAVVVAGGRESANARRLLAIAESSGKPCALAESPADIPPEFFGLAAVGLAAGASTPDSAIDAIERALADGAARHGAARQSADR